MAVRQFNSTELIAYVRERGKLSSKGTQGTTDQDILNRLNETMLEFVVPMVRRMREEYFVVTRRYSISSGRIRIPARAVGQQIRNIFYIQGSDRCEVVKIRPEDLPYWNAATGTEALGYYIEGNYLVFPGEPEGTMEISFLARPGQLVLAEEVRVIASVDTETRAITLTESVPESWETVVHTFDVHSAHSGAELKIFDMAQDNSVAPEGALLTLAGAIDGSEYGTIAPEAGDYVTLAGEAALPALPIEYHVLLAQATVCRMIEALGDFEAKAAHEATLAQMVKNGQSIIQNRTDSHPNRIISRNPLW